MLPYGERFHKHRAMIRKYFQPNAAKNYHAIQIEKTHLLIANIMRDPHNFLQHIRTTTGAIIMKVAYGYEGFFAPQYHLTTKLIIFVSVSPVQDSFIQLSDTALQWFSKAAVPGGYLVDFLPWRTTT